MNRQKMQDFALVAEIVAGVSIVVTLAFLAVEMRSNTDAIRAQTYDGLMEQLNSWREHVVIDEELAAYQVQFRNKGWSGLSEVAQERWWFRGVMLFGIYENAFYAQDRGTLGEDEWTRFHEALCDRYLQMERFGLPEGKDINVGLTPRFSEYMKNECQE